MIFSIVVYILLIIGIVALCVFSNTIFRSKDSDYRLYIYFKQNMSIENATKIIESYNCSVIDYNYNSTIKVKNTYIPALEVKVKVPDNKNPEDYSNLISKNPFVLTVKLVRIDY